MKNKEKYAEQIAEIACESSSFGIDKHAGVVMSCRSLRCSECSFYMSADCDKTRKEWAESEYVERPVISKRDRAFLDYMDSDLKYIARDRAGILYAYDYIPHKGKNMWISYSGTINPFVRFPMVKWEDENPWLIEDLKKLEVVDEY